MKIEITYDEIRTLLTSLDFSKQRVRDAQGTPYPIRQENLARLDGIAAKLREGKSGSKGRR
jgi:hypothetical protein